MSKINRRSVLRVIVLLVTGFLSYEAGTNLPTELPVIMEHELDF